MNVPFLAKPHGDVSHNNSVRIDHSEIKEEDLNFTNILMNAPSTNPFQPKTVQLISIDMNLVNKESLRKTRGRFHSESAKLKLASMTDPSPSKMNGFNLFSSPVIRGQRVLLTSNRTQKSAIVQSPSDSFNQTRTSKFRHLAKSSFGAVDQSQTQSSRLINNKSILPSPIFLQPFTLPNSPEKQIRQIAGRVTSNREVSFIGNEGTFPMITPKVESKDNLNTTNLMWPPIKIKPNIFSNNEKGKSPKRIMKISFQEKQTFNKKVVNPNKDFGDCIKPIISEKNKTLFSTTENFLKHSKMFSLK